MAPRHEASAGQAAELGGAVSDAPGGAMVLVRVLARAGRSGLAGLRGGALLIRVAAPPVDGAANAELLSTLAELLGLPARALGLLAGQRARQKRVGVAGLTAAQVRARLAARLPPAD